DGAERVGAEGGRLGVPRRRVRRGRVGGEERAVDVELDASYADVVGGAGADGDGARHRRVGGRRGEGDGRLGGGLHGGYRGGRGAVVGLVVGLGGERVGSRRRRARVPHRRVRRGRRGGQERAVHIELRLDHADVVRRGGREGDRPVHRRAGGRAGQGHG